MVLLPPNWINRLQFTHIFLLLYIRTPWKNRKRWKEINGTGLYYCDFRVHEPKSNLVSLIHKNVPKWNGNTWVLSHKNVYRTWQIPLATKSFSRCRLDARKKFLLWRMFRHWNMLPREAVDVPYVEVFKARVDGVMGSLIQWVAILPTAVSWNWVVFNVLSDLSCSTILWFSHLL